MKQKDLMLSSAADLGLNTPYVKGHEPIVKNCWHFSTDGKGVDSLFYTVEDFVAGMNRIAALSDEYPEVIILAFVLMDTHVHFVLYGDFEACRRFVHEYVRRTSIYISNIYGERHKLRHLPIDYQEIGDQRYLKTVICYVIKNPPSGGLPYMSYDYPWSSGSLYFRHRGIWTSPAMGEGSMPMDRNGLPMLSPANYVAVALVEQLFRSHKSFNYFLGRSKDSEVEERGGAISMLSIPIQEMRQHRGEVSRELFGHDRIRQLDVGMRLRLARTLRRRYNSSPKQLARVCCLNPDEAAKLI